ncbi:DedA family protein [Oceanicola granulosus HTCC2516]|uniref:DedA family protein n=2 Tax=Oceanicola granulosus TaxID=252302 RepID=Q2CD02_OCEGH|nr:DedA family protein [Oceanicola granulosus HTCC2516]
MWALAIVAFVESSFFPIPPDVLMIPMILARPSRAFIIAGLATAASVTGALLGYWIGHGLYETVGRPVLDFYHMGAQFDDFALRYNEYGVWAVLIAGVTPFPFKVITIASGVTGMNVVAFLLAALVARAARFFLVAALLWKFGPPIREFIERRLGLVFTLFCVLLVGAFLVIPLL